MRTIKFRGFHADEHGETVIKLNGKEIKGTWFYGDLHTDGPYINEHAVIPETVGQYTGLTDSEDKEIYEGDIIKYAHIDNYNAYLKSLKIPDDYEKDAFDHMWTYDKVVYGINMGYPAFDLSNNYFDVNGLSELSESFCYHYEVIGNIFENPELLEVEE